MCCSLQVLGYRHAHGLGVPKSCQAAVLYYQPVAEEVVGLARMPNSLPHVRTRLTQHTMRLSHVHSMCSSVTVSTTTFAPALQPHVCRATQHPKPRGQGWMGMHGCCLGVCQGWSSSGSAGAGVARGQQAQPGAGLWSR